MAKQSSGVRLRFVQDDSCHWYVIPADKDEAFVLWNESFQDEAEAEEYTGEGFEDCRIDGYPGFYTFTDLRQDKD